MMNLRTVFLLGMLLGFGTLFGQVDWLAYRPAGYVSDYAQVFDSESKEALNALIADLNAVHSAQIDRKSVV